MRYDIKVVVAPESDEKKETSKLSLHFEGQTTPVVLDVKGSSLLKVSRATPDLAQDFLCIAACVYAADKALARNLQEDKWTRHIVIEIPVEHVDSWSRVASDLSDCIGFLTGDYWEISFRRGEKRLIQKRTRKRQPRYVRPTGDAVCLFSGGLDSFIGAVDWLCDNPEGRLLLVGHYDRHVAGPAKDQRGLKAVCFHHFPDRFTFAQAQVGLSSGGADTNFRSRSLLFIALGCYFAEVLGEGVPVLIPENGPIALNFPLTSARRGSCSTRTVHPQFINGLNKVLVKVGIKNPVVNPYELKTKGEMVAECRKQNVLESAYSLTRSCAKANRRRYWTNRTARGCGVCVPCLFRRAALYAGGLDDEVYGKHVEELGSLAETPSDLFALVSFLRWNPSDREIAAGLLGNGSLPLDQLKNYVGLTKRMRTEVLVWLKANGADYFKSEVRGC